MRTSNRPQAGRGAAAMLFNRSPWACLFLLSTAFAVPAWAAESAASPRALASGASSSGSPAGNRTLDTSGAASVSTRADFPIRPDDLLSVTVFDVPEMSRDYRVRSDGSISLPLVPGPIPAAGLSADALARPIEDILKSSELVSQPEVSVEVKESRLGSSGADGCS